MRALDVMQDANLYPTMPDQNQAIFDEFKLDCDLARERAEETRRPEATSTIQSSSTIRSSKGVDGVWQRSEDDTDEDPFSLDSSADGPDGHDPPWSSQERHGQAFYVSQKSLAEDQDVEDELPDVGALVSTRKTSQERGDHGPRDRRSVRARRVVLEDEDSDM